MRNGPSNPVKYRVRGNIHSAQPSRLVSPKCSLRKEMEKIGARGFEPLTSSTPS
jgi:hypothetical protein